MGRKTTRKRKRTTPYKYKRPDFAIPLIIIVLLAIIVVGVFVVATAIPSQPVGHFQVFVGSCEENDYGINVDMRGTTIGKTATNTISVTDYCRSDKILIEYWCEDNTIKSSPIECKNQCVNGACITSALV